MSQELEDSVHSVEPSYREGLVRELVDLRQNTRRVASHIWYEEQFALPNVEVLVSHACQRRIFPGPMDRTSIGDPSLSTWEGVWSTSLFLGYFLEKFVGTTYQEMLRRAISSDRPNMYFMEQDCRLGLFARLHSTSTGMILPTTAKDMVPKLMGPDWDEVPFLERFNYWEQPAPVVLINFMQANDIYVMKAPCQVVLEDCAQTLITSLSEVGLRELIEVIIRGDNLPGDSADFKYMVYLLQRGFRQLKLKNPWVSGDEWLARHVDQVKDFLLKENLPEFFKARQTIEMALSVPRS